MDQVGFLGNRHNLEVDMNRLVKAMFFVVLSLVAIRLLGMLLSLLGWLLSVVWAFAPYLIVGGLLFAIARAVPRASNEEEQKN